VIVADRPQHQARAGPVEEQPDSDDERDRDINEGIVTEEDAADERQIGQDRQVEVPGRYDLLADKAGADQSR
jgi:hypothetical protein